MDYDNNVINITSESPSSSVVAYDMLNNALSCQYMTPTLKQPIYKLYNNNIQSSSTTSTRTRTRTSPIGSCGNNESVISNEAVISYLYYNNSNDDDEEEEEEEDEDNNNIIEINNKKKFKDNWRWWYNKSVNNCRNWLTNIKPIYNNNIQELSNRILAIDPTGGGGGGGGGGCRLCDITINNSNNNNDIVDNNNNNNDDVTMMSNVKYININKNSRKDGGCITEIKSQALGLDDEYAFITTDTSFYITSLKTSGKGEEEEFDDVNDVNDVNDDDVSSSYSYGRYSNKVLLSESRGIDVSHVFPGKAVIVTPTSLLQYDPNKDKLINIFNIGKGCINHDHGGRSNVNNNNATTTQQQQHKIRGLKEDDYTNTSSLSLSIGDDDYYYNRRFTGVCYSYIHPEVLFIGGIRLSMIDMRCPIYPKLKTLNNNIQPSSYYVGLLQNWDVDNIYYWTALTTFDNTLPYQIAASSRRHSSIAIMDIRGGTTSSTSSCGSNIPIIAEWPLPTRQDLWLSMILQDGAALPSCTSIEYIKSNNSGDGGGGGGGKILSFIPYEYGSSVTCVNYNNNGMFSRPTHLFHDNRRNNNALSGCTFVNYNNTLSTSSIGVAALNWKGHLMLATEQQQQQEEEQEPTSSSSSSAYSKKNNNKTSSSSSCIIPVVKSKLFKPISYRQRDWAPQLLRKTLSSTSSSSNSNNTTIISRQPHYDDDNNNDIIGKYINYDNDIIIILVALGIIYPNDNNNPLLLFNNNNTINGCYNNNNNISWINHLKYNNNNTILLSNILQRHHHYHDDDEGKRIGIGDIIHNTIINTQTYHWLSMNYNNKDKKNNNNKDKKNNNNKEKNNNNNNNNKCVSGMKYWDYFTLYRQSLLMLNSYHHSPPPPPSMMNNETCYSCNNNNMKDCRRPLNRDELLSILKVLQDDGLLNIELSNNNNEEDWIAIPIHKTKEVEEEKLSTRNNNGDLEYNNNNNVSINGNNNTTTKPLISKSNIDMDTIKNVINKWDNNNDNDNNKDERKRRYIKL